MRWLAVAIAWVALLFVAPATALILAAMLFLIDFAMATYPSDWRFYGFACDVARTLRAVPGTVRRGRPATERAK